MTTPGKPEGLGLQHCRREGLRRRLSGTVLLSHVDVTLCLAEDGTEFVITRYREATQNLGTQGKRIVRQAGLKPWPKLFQNLRSTRETELAEDYPMHVVCAWIGNSQPIAAKHYLQVTAAHFSRAVEGPESSAAPALQNPVQQSHETPGNDSQVVNTAQKETPTFAGDFSSLRRDAVNISYPART